MTEFYRYIAIKADGGKYWLYDRVDIDMHGIAASKPLCKVSGRDIDWSITKCVK